MKTIQMIWVVALLLVTTAIARADWNALHTAVESGDESAVAGLVKRDQSLVNSRDVGEHTPLHVAAFDGRERVVEMLVKANADVCAKDVCGWTPLHTAAVRNQAAIVEFLLAHGADRNAKDSHGQTPLRLARKYKSKKVIDLLTKVGATE